MDVTLMEIKKNWDKENLCLGKIDEGDKCQPFRGGGNVECQERKNRKSRRRDHIHSPTGGTHLVGKGEAREISHGETLYAQVLGRGEDRPEPLSSRRRWSQNNPSRGVVLAWLLVWCLERVASLSREGSGSTGRGEEIIGSGSVKFNNSR